MTRTAIISVLCLGLMGCGAVNLTVSPVLTETVQEPKLSELRTSEVGDVLVRTARVSQVAAVNLMTEIVAKGTGWAAGNKLTIKPGIMPARYSNSVQICYMSLEPVVYSNFIAKGSDSSGICISRTNPRKIVVVGGEPGRNAVYKPLTPVNIEATTWTDKTAPGQWQELIYNGKAGDTVKFLYREFTNDRVGPFLDQVVQHDLRESSTVDFKGARIEVVEATNLAIRYRVLAHFPVPR